MKLFFLLWLVTTATLTYATSVPDDYELQEIPVNGRLVVKKTLVLKGGSEETVFISRTDGIEFPKGVRPRGGSPKGEQRCYFTYPELAERKTLSVNTELKVISKKRKRVLPTTFCDCFHDENSRDNFGYELQLKLEKDDFKLTMFCGETWAWRAAWERASYTFYQAGETVRCDYWHSPLLVNFIATHFDILMP